MESQEKPKGYTVRDRRRFTESGETRTEEAAEESVQSGAESSASRVRPDDDAHATASSHGAAEPISLGAFLVSLSTQALVLLGEMPNPVTGETGTDLRGAREIVDLIAMLQEKTRGNLDPSEARLFDKILYDLRLRYVEKARR